MMKKLIVLAMATILLLSTLLISCAPKKQTTLVQPSPTTIATTAPTTAPAATPVATPVATPTETQQPAAFTGKSPFDNTPISPENEKKRPIAVMIDNIDVARPQSGVSDAEIVYEMPVEGGITRLMLVFQHALPGIIGPVRSARPCFLDRALEFNAIYVHCGGSALALTQLKTSSLGNLDQMTADGNIFRRATHRTAPHNLYTSMENLRKAATDKKYETGTPTKPLFLFNDTDIVYPELNAKKTNILIDNGYKITYDYNSKTNSYLRSVGNAPYVDETTKKQIDVKNIILQYVNTKMDGVYTVVASIDKGTGFFVSGGKQIPITWEKKDRNSITVFRNEKGEEIKLNTGKTWIHVLAKSNKISFE